MSQFPSITFYHGDKTTLRDIVPLTDKGAGATLGWRTQQYGNVIWTMWNAGSTDGVTFNRDDTGARAFAVRRNADGTVEYLHAAAAANPITWIVHLKHDLVVGREDLTATLRLLGGTGIDVAVGAAVRIGTTDAFDLILKRAGADVVVLKNNRIELQTSINLDSVGDLLLSRVNVLKLTLGAALATFVDPVVLPANPTTSLQAAPKQYVDAGTNTVTRTTNVTATTSETVIDTMTVVLPAGATSLVAGAIARFFPVTSTHDTVYRLYVGGTLRASGRGSAAAGNYDTVAISALVTGLAAGGTITVELRAFASVDTTTFEATVGDPSHLWAKSIR